MYISRIVVRNFRNFRSFDVPIQPGVTCVVGENNTGKSNLLQALRLAIDPNLSSYRRRLDLEDFSVGLNPRSPQHVLASIEFKDFAEDPNSEALVFGCHVDDDTARITYRFRPSRQIREAIEAGENDGTNLSLDDYRWELIGGSDFDPTTVAWDEDVGTYLKLQDLQQGYLVVLMEALRDVEQRLKQSRQSPLQQLLTHEDIPSEEQDELVEILAQANRSIDRSETVSALSSEISEAFKEAAGEAFSMGVKLGMGAPTFADISRGLTVLLSGYGVKNFDPALNGLGLNNILYISMLLKYFDKRVADRKTAGQLLLVEEPEAHLHPQLQRVLFGMLQRKGFQAIVTTHSTHITSRAPLNSLVVLTNDGGAITKSTVPTQSGMNLLEIRDIERYLDATRGALLYARRVMLVEGPAELFLIPPLVEKVMGKRLDEHGISVVPIYGVHFASYARLFGQDSIAKKCAIVADGDLKPSDSSDAEDEDAPDPEIPTLDGLENEYVRVFTCPHTFERSVSQLGNLEMFAVASAEIGARSVARELRLAHSDLVDKDSLTEEDRALLNELKGKVLATAKRFGKARFAQVASKHVSLARSLPKYIRDAVDWLTEE